MFDKLVAAVTDLPVIVQGALGSALFALLLFMGQRLTTWLIVKYSQSSRARKRVFLIEESLKYNLTNADDYATRGAFVSRLSYRALRSLFRSLIWLTLGLIFGIVDKIFSIVGYLGCLYYLFSGLNTLMPPTRVKDVEAKLEEIEAEKKKLGGELNDA